MISVLTLERPGRWRTLAVAGLLLVGFLPVIPLLLRTIQSEPSPVGDTFWASIGMSAELALGL